MSLNWDITDIENYKELCWLDKEDPRVEGIAPGIWTTNKDGQLLNPTTLSMIWATLYTGIGDVKESNVEEFYARATLFGTYKITMQDVKDHIGLSTNVFPEETRTKWVKRVVFNIMDENTYNARKELVKGNG